MAHYLPLGEETPAHLYMRARPPEWLQRLPLPALWHHETVIRETLPAERVSDNLREPRFDVSVASLLGIVPVLQDGWTVFTSSPERAAIELAAGLTRGESWDMAYETFTGLTTLRPALVQQLLTSSTRKVTRRVFLHLARTSGHPWLDRLDLDALDLGQGKRQLVPGGTLDPEFLITVPRREEAHGF
ncbi:type IV toxin-antitoxin system AbiEi family antitoxin domain-containing protein [Deinococcus sp. NW-56]|uniref:type IV toxin-antitoxin system AbiEi family antitoxin domain-containing protein n=1 Tax=Deinococcus sp. NW-56 TaxID=2080419 RepID=UPI001F45C494|nr:type IV toxin-antitoxin system AbiEi family antitoxin domain-containing protein [Deinococcus sp. NW-56]